MSVASLADRLPLRRLVRIRSKSSEPYNPPSPVGVILFKKVAPKAVLPTFKRERDSSSPVALRSRSVPGKVNL